MTLLRPGHTCWRVAPADRVSFLIDAQQYFTASYEALIKAKKQILLLGWGFDPRTRLAPDGGGDLGEPDEVGQILLSLAKARPELDIHVLIWKSALPVRASQEFFPHRARPWFKGTRVQFRLDDTVPLGACHHQKVLVVDDQVAIVGGGDFCADRWDSTAHLDDDNRRLLNHHDHAPRHEVMVMVDGKAAAALGDLARERWRRSTGEVLRRPQAFTEHVWPDFVRPDLEAVGRVGVSRTEPAWRDGPAVQEIRELTLRSIMSAKTRIYLENQYMTAPVYAEALAARLAEQDGPEILLMSTRRSPSWFDQLTMDRARSIFIRRLQDADVFGRLRAFSPSTPGGKVIIVHAKVSILDDDLARVGSANLNNRSGGFDTECEVAVEAETDAHRSAIESFRNRLVGHYMSRPPESVEAAVVQHRGLTGAVDALNRAGRLSPIRVHQLTKPEQIIAAFHLGDPTSAADSMRPIARRRVLHEEVRALAAETSMARWAGLPQDTTAPLTTTAAAGGK